MSSRLTYVAGFTFISVALIAACGGDEDSGSDSEDGTIDVPTGDGDGDGDTGLEPGARVQFEGTPEGFQMYEDGSGVPAYRAPDVTPETVTALQAASTAGLTPAEGSEFAYPLPNTMVPWNLTFLEMQFTLPVGGIDDIMLVAKGPSTNYHLYLKAECTPAGYCVVDVPTTEWQTIGRQNLGEDVVFELYATNGSDSYAVAPLTVRFSPEDLLGALYYWASASRSIKRASFGATAATDFIQPGVNVNYECVSCHSVSRDGTTIAFGVSPEEGENISGIQVTSTSDPTMVSIEPTKGTTPYSSSVAHSNTEGPVDSLGHNVALNPDGSIMAVNSTGHPDNWPIRLEIKSTATKDSVLQSYEIGDPVFGADKVGIHPEFSPEGNQLVVTLAENDGRVSAWSNTAGGIAAHSFDSATGTLGAATLLATPPAGAYYFYPTWSPDSKYVVFVASWDENGGKGSLENRNGVLFMVPTSGGPYTCPGTGCFELSRGTGYSAADAQAMMGTTGSTWPKFTPFAQGAEKNVYFVSFTSRREHGFLGGGTSQIWMFGIDTSEPTDPSFSPFWLPYQDKADGSLTPYWTESLPCDIEGGTCNGCIGEEYCVVNRETNACRCQVIQTR